MGLVTARFVLAFAFGIVTVGALSKVPDTVTVALELERAIPTTRSRPGRRRRRAEPESRQQYDAYIPQGFVCEDESAYRLRLAAMRQPGHTYR